ncbi:hypothetical protein QTN24_01465 [Cupriavidus sp. SZY C1]|uniref:hypothetical protein n=1 Tax=Cupriavidus sp. SZY C1 TaxID=3055037 RepID=UPI0028BC76FC|nr:hypothetical protein [Cupriavidus sp. SZY C1]MDT6960153.1 hypothetical protein [Cupriavidus sp. SZY C1]
MSEKVWGVASYTLVGTILVLAGGYVAWRCEIDPGDIASWVQAVGAIAAIWGAFAISRSQSLSDARDRHQEKLRAELDQINAVFAILTEIEAVLTTVTVAARTAIEAGEHTDFHPTVGRRVSERLLTHLGAVPLHAMPYARMARGIAMAQTAVEYFLEIADELHDGDIERAHRQLSRLEKYQGFIKTAARIVRRNSRSVRRDERAAI